MTTLIPKFDLKNGALTPTGAINRPINLKLEESVSVLDFGAVGDGTTDDTTAIQNAIDGAIAQQKSLYFPRTSTGLGLYLISAPLTISASINIYGDGIDYSGIKCNNCSGFIIDAGVNLLTIEKLAIVMAVRYDTTPNTCTAITTLGTNASRNYWHIYRDLFIDGFQFALNVSYTWSTLFNSITAVYCWSGINATGLSVNNFISNCSLSGISALDSSGIGIGDGTTVTEGWIISNNLISAFGTAIYSTACGNSIASGNIIDFCQQRGIALVDSANGASLNWNITDNYIATGYASALVGIFTQNNYAASAFQNRGHSITNNQIVQYVGANWSYGINITGTYESNLNITGNRVVATTYVCSIVSTVTNASITNNKWYTGIFYSDALVIYANNSGTIGSSDTLLKQTNGKTTFYHDSVAPTTGSYSIGDIVYNTAPTSGNYVGWVCTASGSPGTWKTFGLIS